MVLEDLSFPELTSPRTRVLEALIETSARPDAFARLFVGPSKAAEVARNTHLHELPATPVLALYSGPLHEGLDAASWSPAAADRAGRSVVVASALWGLVRPADRIPPYRLHICSHLVGMERLEPFWRPVIGDPLAEAAGPDGVVIDLRSPSYQAMGVPTGLAKRTVTLRVGQAGAGGRRIGDVIVKRTRGQAARHLLERGVEPATPDDLADLLAERWPVRLDAPVQPGVGWTLTLTATD